MTSSDTIDDQRIWDYQDTIIKFHELSINESRRRGILLKVLRGVPKDTELTNRGSKRFGCLFFFCFYFLLPHGVRDLLKYRRNCRSEQLQALWTILNTGVTLIRHSAGNLRPEYANDYWYEPDPAECRQRILCWQQKHVITVRRCNSFRRRQRSRFPGLPPSPSGYRYVHCVGNRHAYSTNAAIRHLKSENERSAPSRRLSEHRSVDLNDLY